MAKPRTPGKHNAVFGTVLRPEVAKLMEAAGSAHHLDRLDEAEELCAQALAIQPNQLQALLLGGVVAAKLQRPEVALERLQKVVRGDPRCFVAWNWMSLVFRQKHQVEEATLCAEKAEKLSPNNPDVLCTLGQCYLLGDRFKEAVSAFQRAVGLAPGVATYWYGLGSAFRKLGAESDAIRALKKAVDISPEAPGLLMLAGLQLNLGNAEEAIGLGLMALKLEPGATTVHSLLAEAFNAANRQEEAAEQLDHALELAPEDSDLHVQRGQRHQLFGRFAEAEADLYRSLEIQPRQGAAYYALLSAKKATPADQPLIERMQELTQDPLLDSNDLPRIYYSLGKAFDDLGNYESAIQYFDDANRLAKKLWMSGRGFDRKAYERETDQRIELFTKEFLSQTEEAGFDTDLPIVIVGMMRAGTTLAEQILSSHPKIGPAGEQGFWTNREQVLVDYSRKRIDPLNLEEAAREYCGLLQRNAPAYSRVTDKNPANILVAGLINMALPNARIIHTRRQPVDTALSIWMTPVRHAPPFMCDKEDIVFAYKQHLRLMQRWREVLPADRYLEIDYEELTADRETVTRRMVAFCGLEWDDACLHPEQNQRAVNTPSFWQVRQPIYATSVDRWKRYEPWLGAFRELRDL